MNRAALERALNDIIRRHQALRTRFIAQGSTAVPVIDIPADVFLASEDYSALGPEESVAKATELTDQYRIQPFELDGGSLFRACLVKLADNFHLLLMMVHHIVFDAWSAAILRRELNILYRTYVEGKTSPLPEPRIQLSDLTLWENHWIDAAGYADPYAFWEQRLAGLQSTELPTDWPRRPDSFDSPEATIAIELPSETTSALRRMSLSQGATVQMSLLAIYCMLLSRWCGRADVLIGNYSACRVPPGVEQLVGCLATSRPIYVTVSPEISFSAHLHRVRSAYSEALDLRKPVSLRMSWQTRLNRIVANFWKTTQTAPQAQNTAAQFRGKPTIIYHDVALLLVEMPDVIRGSISYASDLFAAKTVTAFCNDFKIAAHKVAHEPDRAIAAATD